MSKAQPEVSINVEVLMVPWQNTHLLLPNVSVVELLRMRDIEVDHTEDKNLNGHFSWRNRILPLLDLGAILGIEAEVKGSKPRVLICHNFESNNDCGFFGIETHGIPNLSILDEGKFEMLDMPDGDLPLVAKIQMDERTAYVPDMEKLSHLLNKK